MLVERGLRVQNIDVIGRAYDIAANYLRRTGAIPDFPNRNDVLLELVVGLFHRGESHQIRLANLAIARFQALRLRP